MSDVFSSSNAKNLLENKFVLLMGDSNIRSIYIDLINLLNSGTVCPPEHFLRPHDERRLRPIEGDIVVSISPKEFNRGRDFFEEREFKKNNLHVRYHFLTNIFKMEMKKTIKEIQDGIIPVPHIIILNSCVWDLTRWGARKESEYKKNMVEVFTTLTKMLPEDTLIIWATTMPFSSKKTKGGLFIPQLEFVKHHLGFTIMEANKFAQQLCMAFGVDLLDLHYQMRFQIHRRAVDGFHWETHAYRYITCCLLTHISLAFDDPLPGNVDNDFLHKTIDDALRCKKPPPLSDIGFDKDLQDMIKDYLKYQIDRIETVESKKPPLPKQKKKHTIKVEERVKATGKRRIRNYERKSVTLNLEANLDAPIQQKSGVPVSNTEVKNKFNHPGKGLFTIKPFKVKYPHLQYPIEKQWHKSTSAAEASTSNNVTYLPKHIPIMLSEKSVLDINHCNDTPSPYSSRSNSPIVPCPPSSRSNSPLVPCSQSSRSNSPHLSLPYDTSPTPGPSFQHYNNNVAPNSSYYSYYSKCDNHNYYMERNSRSNINQQHYNQRPNNNYIDRFAPYRR